VIAAVCLLAYTGLLLTIGASQLVRAGWTDRAPRLAIAAWLALNSSAIGSVILGGLALVVPTAGVSYHLADLLAACAHDVRARYAHPGGAALAAAGAVLTFAVAVRVGLVHGPHAGHRAAGRPAALPPAPGRWPHGPAAGCDGDRLRRACRIQPARSPPADRAD
jgi:hypothetical protein